MRRVAMRSGTSTMHVGDAGHLGADKSTSASISRLPLVGATTALAAASLTALSAPVVGWSLMVHSRSPRRCVHSGFSIATCGRVASDGKRQASPSVWHRLLALVTSRDFMRRDMSIPTNTEFVLGRGVATFTCISTVGSGIISRPKRMVVGFIRPFE
jgi:hypothetical protein